MTSIINNTNLADTAVREYIEKLLSARKIQAILKGNRIVGLINDRLVTIVYKRKGERDEFTVLEGAYGKG